jgi:hypothetical protein
MMYFGTGFVLYYSFRFFWVSGCSFNKFMLMAVSFICISFTVLIIL